MQPLGTTYSTDIAAKNLINNKILLGATPSLGSQDKPPAFNNTNAAEEDVSDIMGLGKRPFDFDNNEEG